MRGAATGAGGFGLVELMVVMVLAGMLMFGITVLYLAAQRTWLESSSKLFVQQEATLLLNAIGNPVRQAHDFQLAAPDSSAVILQKCDPGHSASSHVDFLKIHWNPADSLIHLDRLTPPVQTGLDMSRVRVTRLRFSGVAGQPNKLKVATLRARDPYGQVVELSSEFVLQNFSSGPSPP